MKIYSLLSTLCLALTSCFPSLHAANPIITDVFTADPAPLVHKDKVYLYVGQDAGDGKGYHMPRWRVFSSDDLVNWTDEGSPLQPSDFKWSTGGATSWAGHTVEKDGKFYWYITCDHARVGGKAIGVAVADSPTGPFKDARGSALITNDMTRATNISWDDIDPAVFIDDDGQAWLFWGNQKCYYAKLKDNMIELDGPIHVIPDEQVERFTEAPWIHKRNGIYYLTYAIGFPEQTGYSVSKSITGPWFPKGLLAEGAQNSNTIHQGIITFKGKDYFFYHSGMIQHDQGAGRGRNGGGSYLRSVCIDELHYNEDGSLQRVVQTSEGVEAVDSMTASPMTDAENPLQWVNPIVPQRADPHVFLHTDGYYYLIATVPEYDRIELRRARTLGGLSTAEPKVIWRKHPHGIMGAHIWAPEIHFIDGKWYVYFTAGEAENAWAIRLYTLETAAANPLEGKWKENGKLKLNWESFSLDATTFEHRGVRYLSWTQIEDGVKGTNIYIAKMDTPTSITGEAIRLTQPDYEWERRGHWVTEAPAVLVRNDKVFLTYSASATDANYCLGMLTADASADLLDPESWRKSPEPVLKSDPSVSQFGTGHNSFTTTPDGKTDILVYHARNYEHIHGNSLYNPDRATRAQVIRWKPDGTPEFGTPVPDGPYSIDSTHN